MVTALHDLPGRRGRACRSGSCRSARVAEVPRAEWDERRRSRSACSRSIEVPTLVLRTRSWWTRSRAHRERRRPRPRARRRAGSSVSSRHRRRAGARDRRSTITAVIVDGDPVVLVSGVRTAIGRFGGALKDVEAHELGAACIREALARAGVEPDEVDEIVMGQVGQVGPDAYNARRCALAAGIPAGATAMNVEPALLLRPAGDRHRRTGDPHRPGEPRRRRRRRVDEPPAVPRLRRSRRLASGVPTSRRRDALARHRPVRAATPWERPARRSPNATV